MLVRLLHGDDFNRIIFLLNSWEIRFYNSLYRYPKFSEKQLVKIEDIHSRLPEHFIEDINSGKSYYEYGIGHRKMLNVDSNLKKKKKRGA
jgi:hypothetical protein